MHEQREIYHSDEYVASIVYDRPKADVYDLDTQTIGASLLVVGIYGLAVGAVLKLLILLALWVAE